MPNLGMGVAADKSRVVYEGLRAIALRVLTTPDGDAAGSAASSADAHNVYNASTLSKNTLIISIRGKARLPKTS